MEAIRHGSYSKSLTGGNRRERGIVNRMPVLEAHLICSLLVVIDLVTRALRFQWILAGLRIPVSFRDAFVMTTVGDAAAAVTWTQAHIAEHGGDARRLFVGGHSAGGYITLMLGMDPHFLHDAGLEPSAIAGFIPIRGQTMTHYTVRGERGIGKFTVIADEAAPVHFARQETPPA